MERYPIVFLLFLCFCLFDCVCMGEGQSIKMSTTTSTQNSGLLDVLLPAFEEECAIKVYPIAAGTGKALKLAENGDVDLVMVHMHSMELEFVKNGFGVDRKTVFYNDFVIVGPKNDPAAVMGSKGAAEVFRKISESGSIFVSRGDNSGTHAKEIEIWAEIGVSPEGRWYVQTGQGMGATLVIADEKNGYCLVDTATFFSYKDKVDLVILHEADPSLRNLYSVIAVNPSLYPGVKYREAKLFIDWISSAKAKAIIKGFKKNGKVLFCPLD